MLIQPNIINNEQFRLTTQELITQAIPINQIATKFQLAPFNAEAPYNNFVGNATQYKLLLIL